MKKVKVIVRDRNTLVIDDDAQKGDYIDLSSISEIDFSTLEKAINDGADRVYEKHLNEFKKSLMLENEKDVLILKSKFEEERKELQHKLDTIANEKENLMKLKETELVNKYKLELSSKEQETQKRLIEVQTSKDMEINALKQQIISLKEMMNTQVELEKMKLTQNYDKEINDLKINHNKELEQKNEMIKAKEEAFNQLQRQRAALNVKQTGEDLESWCNNEVISYMQNGLFNCTWSKDNEVIRDEDETKGSKADYIFKVYVDSKHEDSDLLASVCLDMKDENPDSVNKKTNADYYKQLDKNRMKKNCKYAVLVSNLEMDKPNDLPIYKVNEYEDMYVVRPAYMMTFLNMLTSLTVRFAQLILVDKNEKLELKNSLDLMEMFNELKTTYLDKPLEGLENNIEAIRKSNENIIKASRSIEDTCDKMVKNYINVIQDKLNKFEIKINKGYKKLYEE